MTTDSPAPAPVTQRPRGASALDESRPAPIGRESFNLPNTVTVARLLLACVLFGMIAYNGLWKSAAALFVFAASTDFLDGWLARKYGQVTTLGRILDPFVDKIVVVGALLFLLEKRVTLEGGELVVWSGVSAWMVLVIVAREMFVSSLRGFLEKHGIDFSADWTGKVKTTVQFVAVTASLLSLAPEFARLAPLIDGRSWFLWTRDALLWGAALFTAYSGVAYVARGMRELKR
ncbi:CDP-diacylglycerol--glycerol-3-phosphate 3-phosphatidyltransferase [Alienimonas sp. DA493]|uniref:CDP-diacylglycerol--glycerol-3-phosphate 3-phosphatidyltransferase n=1 Tax=Alienimonas sp. DA493 TaxID=3373605 RepID=UPI003754DE35